MNTRDLLSNVKVAAPCAASWDRMTGDDRARFCSLCQKNVYNLSALTAAEVTALIQEKEWKLCGRFYRRSDGTMLTADCSVGLRNMARRLRALSVAAAGLLFASLTASMIGGRSDSPAHRTPTRLSQLWNEAVPKGLDMNATTSMAKPLAFPGSLNPFVAQTYRILLLTLAAIAALGLISFYTHLTKRDFSFPRGFLWAAFFILLSSILVVPLAHNHWVSLGW